MSADKTLSEQFEEQAEEYNRAKPFISEFAKLQDEIDRLRAELDRANKIVKWYERECGDQTTNEMYCMWEKAGMPEEYSDDIYRPTPEAYKPEEKE